MIEQVQLERDPDPEARGLLYENACEWPELPDALRARIAEQGQGAEFFPLLHAAQRTIQVGRDEGRYWEDAVRISLARWF